MKPSDAIVTLESLREYGCVSTMSRYNAICDAIAAIREREELRAEVEKLKADNDALHAEIADWKRAMAADKGRAAGLREAAEIVKKMHQGGWVDSASLHSALLDAAQEAEDAAE